MNARHSSDDAKRALRAETTWDTRPTKVPWLASLAGLSCTTKASRWGSEPPSFGDSIHTGNYARGRQEVLEEIPTFCRHRARHGSAVTRRAILR